VAAERVFDVVTEPSGNGQACPTITAENCLYADTENPEVSFQTLSDFQQCQPTVRVVLNFGEGVVCDAACQEDVRLAIAQTFLPAKVDVKLVQSEGRRLLAAGDIQALVYPAADATGDQAISFDDITEIAITNQEDFIADLAIVYQNVSTSNGNTPIPVDSLEVTVEVVEAPVPAADEKEEIDCYTQESIMNLDILLDECTIVDGYTNTILFIAAGGVLLLLLCGSCICCYCCCCKKNGSEKEMDVDMETDAYFDY